MKNNIATVKKLLDAHMNQLKIYILFGLIAFAADFLTLKLCLVAGAQLFIATSAGVTVGFIVSYFANHFRIGSVAKTKQKRHSLPLFALVFAWNIFFTFIFINTFNHHFSTPLIIPKAMSVGLVMFWNYGLYHFIFRNRTPYEGSHPII